jgi:hypothetical protein
VYALDIFNEAMKAVMLTIKTGLLGISADGLALVSALRHDMPGTEDEQGPISLTGQVMMTFIDDVVMQKNRKDPLSLLNLVGIREVFCKQLILETIFMGFWA